DPGVWELPGVGMVLQGLLVSLLGAIEVRKIGPHRSKRNQILYASGFVRNPAASSEHAVEIISARLIDSQSKTIHFCCRRPANFGFSKITPGIGKTMRH